MDMSNRAMEQAYSPAIAYFRSALSEFSPANAPRGLGGLNRWVDSRTYKVMEMVYQIWTLAVRGANIEAAQYRASAHEGRGHLQEGPRARSTPCTVGPS